MIQKNNIRFISYIYCIKDILENVIRDKTNIEIPVIAGIDLDYEEMIQLKVMFSQNGYYAINLQKNPLDENVIPLEYYDDSNESLNDILYTVYPDNQIYALL